MERITQNTIQNSINKDLLSTDTLVDGRTEVDYAYFLTEFSSLINFYTKTNELKGNWAPFLLKDPYFLLVQISKTPIKEIQTKYIRVIASLEKKLNTLPQNKVTNITNEESETISFLINDFFKQVKEIFQLIGAWVHAMLLSSYNYPFKTYMLNEVRETHSLILWALTSLQEQLGFTLNQKEIEFTVNEKLHFSIEPLLWSEYEIFDKKLWKENKGKLPYWEVFGFKAPLKELLSAEFLKTHYKEFLEQLFKGFKDIGDKVVSFFYALVTAAGKAYEGFKIQKNKFPDTMLLRTFTELLKPYTNKINTLTKKHLNFYYRDILKQQELKASPDSVYVIFDLLKKTETFQLSVNTIFEAGLDKNKIPIEYITTEDVLLNPAVIKNAYTLTKIPTRDSVGSSLYLTKISKPNTPKKAVDGKTISWYTLGSQYNLEGAKQKNMEFIIASPMYYATEGLRNISTVLSFTEPIDPPLLQQARYYVSTKSGWFQVSEKDNTLRFPTKLDKTSKPKLWFLFTIHLKAMHPPLEVLESSDANFLSEWPMLKIVFSSFTKIENPPCLRTIDVVINSKEIHGFELYNDNGALASNKPFQPLGVTPERGANFILGNKEAFSKPLEKISFDLQWANLPTATNRVGIHCFQDYYCSYNQFLNNQNFYADPSAEVNETGNHLFFKNDAFKVGFAVLHNTSWQTLISNQSLYESESITSSNIKKNLSKASEKNTALTHHNSEDGNIIWYNPLAWIYLLIRILKRVLKEKKHPFVPETTLCETSINNTSSFKLNNVMGKQCPNPYLQLRNQVFSAASENGFVRMQLTEPTYGFGTNIFPQVVNAVALVNAFQITKAYKNSTTSTTIATPNIPYTPLVSKITGSYVAKQVYFLGSKGIHVDSLKINVDDLKATAKLLQKSDEETIQELSGVVIKYLFEVKMEKVKKFVTSLDTNLDTFIENIKVKLDSYTNAKHLNKTTAKSVLRATYLSEELATFFSKDVGKEKLIGIFTTILGNEASSLFYEFLFVQRNRIVKNGGFQAENIHSIVNDYLSSLHLASDVFNAYLDQSFKKFSTLLAQAMSNNYNEVHKKVKQKTREDLKKEIEASIDAYKKQKKKIFNYLDDALRSKSDTVATVEEWFDNDVIEVIKNEKGEANYPLECFYKTPFTTYKIFDTNSGIQTGASNLGGNTKFSTSTFPLYPSFYGKGQLFLELEYVATNYDLHLFFELDRDEFSQSLTSDAIQLSYFYLSTDGWKLLHLKKDETHNLTCSGILTFYLPTDIKKNKKIKSNHSFWLNIVSESNPDLLSKTNLLSTNGVKLQRTENSIAHHKISKIKAGSITSPKYAISQIASVIQPFESFGGRAAETEQQMQKRVSRRIKTKDRCITPLDFYTQIQQNFPEVFYSHAYFDKNTDKVKICLVKAISKATDSNAFTPMVSNCTEFSIANFLQQRVSSTTKLSIGNFRFVYVKIKGNIKFHKNFEQKAVEDQVNQGINIYLSPWIRSSQQQISINTGVTSSQIAAFIKSYSQISEVDKLTIVMVTKEKENGRITCTENSNSPHTKSQNIENAIAVKKGELLVPSLDYNDLKYNAC